MKNPWSGTLKLLFATARIFFRGNLHESITGGIKKYLRIL